jgi:hypothetical protein
MIAAGKTFDGRGPCWQTGARVIIEKVAYLGGPSPI